MSFNRWYLNKDEDAIMKKIFFDLMVSQPDLGSKFHGGGEYTKTFFK